MRIKVNADFRRDWTQHIKNELLNAGLDLQNLDGEKVCQAYFNYKKRLIPSRPRTVLVSKELKCPDLLIPGYNAFKQKTEVGDDLTPFLSTRIEDLNYDDDLLNDWGIHHIHLGTTIDGRGFIDRTGPLLFVRFTNDIAYFIAIMPHGSWTKQEMLKILYHNWPESIEPYRAHGFSRLNFTPTDKDIKNARNGHLNLMIEIEPGAIYIPPGGGLNTAGGSIEVIMVSDRYLRFLRDIEKHLKDNIDDILIEAGAKVDDTDEVGFHLEIKDNSFYAVDDSGCLHIKYGNPFEIP